MLKERASMENRDIRIRTGLRIKELRDAVGLSQEALAWSIGMARSYLAEVETGKRNVSLLNLEKIARGLNTTLGEFFTSEIFDDD